MSRRRRKKEEGKGRRGFPRSAEMEREAKDSSRAISQFFSFPLHIHSLFRIRNVEERPRRENSNSNLKLRMKYNFKDLHGGPILIGASTALKIDAFPPFCVSMQLYGRWRATKKEEESDENPVVIILPPIEGEEEKRSHKAADFLV